MTRAVSVQCSHCGTLNTTQSQACLQCGYILSAKAPRKTTRRNLLIAGGVLLTGCVAISDVNKLLSGPLFPDKHLLYEMDWSDWLNFVWMPDNQQLLCLKKTGELALLDITSQQINFLKQRIWSGDEDTMYSTFVPTWSNDRNYLVYPSGLQNAAVHNNKNGTLVQIPAEPRVGEAVWSPDGKQLACCSIEEGPEAVLSVWEAQGGKLIWKKVLPRNVENFASGAVLVLCWSPDSKSISFSFHYSSALYVWRASDGMQLWEQRFTSLHGVTELRCSADGKALAVSFDSSLYSGISNVSTTPQIVIWDIQTGQKLFECQVVANYTSILPLLSTSSISWSPTGARLAFFIEHYGKAVLQVWDIHSGRLVFSSQPLDSNPGSLSWSPDGQIIAAGSYIEPEVDIRSGNNADYGSKSTIQFWDAHNGRSLVSYEAPRRPAFFNWSPDSRFLATLNMQTFGCGWHQCDYGYSRDGVGSQNFMVALQIFQAPTLTSKKE